MALLWLARMGNHVIVLTPPKWPPAKKEMAARASSADREHASGVTPVVLTLESPHALAQLDLCSGRRSEGGDARVARALRGTEAAVADTLGCAISAFSSRFRVLL